MTWSETITDARGTHLDLLHVRDGVALYDAWISAERAHSDFGRLGLVEAGPGSYTVSQWMLSTAPLEPYPVLDDAALVLRCWHQILVERGVWAEDELVHAHGGEVSGQRPRRFFTTP
ncbi:hypothetical protein M3666_12075 [Curtobacterium sp. ODYSSEY 48 V2]|uniref:hypothetical protein n=1 Tax=Curtobacterium sp. ODYSSEY 48 V2 TaxID=2939561 RepID=UPI00203E2C63|nr:hypothetical protein [Curtobacterium sp. ODYSSEY 48 V2]MCM3505851.1 hypothetical protein [Curtobacterium sp. ODYSSEY 48 V2]